jgi:hypothetical protein
MQVRPISIEKVPHNFILPKVLLLFLKATNE